eukprot:3546528-Amphidinium_carterae.1
MVSDREVCKVSGLRPQRQGGDVAHLPALPRDSLRPTGSHHGSVWSMLSTIRRCQQLRSSDLKLSSQCVLCWRSDAAGLSCRTELAKLQPACATDTLKVTFDGAMLLQPSHLKKACLAFV